MPISHTPTIQRIAVYCGSASGNSPVYSTAAKDLGRALADRGIELVYGGGNVGLMGDVANACLAAGGTVRGVMPKHLVDLEISHPGLSSLEVTETMAQRKRRMEDLAQAYVALPGGTGTLEELFQVIVRQQLEPGMGPVALFNVDKFWEPLLQALYAMSAAGFLDERFITSLIVVDTPEELFAELKDWTPPTLKWDR